MFVNDIYYLQYRSRGDEETTNQSINLLLRMEHDKYGMCRWSTVVVAVDETTNEWSNQLLLLLLLRRREIRIESTVAVDETTNEWANQLLLLLLLRRRADDATDAVDDETKSMALSFSVGTETTSESIRGIDWWCDRWCCRRLDCWCDGFCCELIRGIYCGGCRGCGRSGGFELLMLLLLLLWPTNWYRGTRIQRMDSNCCCCCDRRINATDWGYNGWIRRMDSNWSSHCCCRRCCDRRIVDAAAAAVLSCWWDDESKSKRWTVPTNAMSRQLVSRY